MTHDLVDPLDLVYARRLGIVVVATPDANAVSVAEHAVTLVLAGVRPPPLPQPDV